MGDFRIVPMPEEVAAQVRETLQTPAWGYPATVEEKSPGYGPCRTCLRMFEIGVETRILFTYDPFAGREPYPLPGPVFIHAEACEPYRDTAAFPDALRRIGVTLNGYGAGRLLRRQVRIEDGDVETAIEQLFADPSVDYIHIHNTQVGCFLLAVERTGREAGANER